MLLDGEGDFAALARLPGVQDLRVSGGHARLELAEQADPDALLRVYHDARQVEVEALRQQTLPTHRLYEAPGLMNKWRVNLFVFKWLVFCLRQGHLFVDDVTALREPACDLS